MVLTEYRSQDFPTPGGPPRIQSEQINPVVSAALQTWRKSDNIALWTLMVTREVINLQAMTWYMTKMIYEADDIETMKTNRLRAIVREVAARQEKTIVTIVHHDAMTGGHGAEVEIRDRWTVERTRNCTRWCASIRTGRRIGYVVSLLYAL